MAPQWRVRKPDGTIYGPADTETVRRLLRERMISPHDKISLEGMENWRPVNETIEFHDILKSEPPQTIDTRHRRVAIGVGAFAILCVAACLVAVFLLRNLVLPPKTVSSHEVVSAGQKKTPAKLAVTPSQKPDSISDAAEAAQSAVPEEPKTLKPLIPEPAGQQAAPSPEPVPSQPVAPAGSNFIRNGDFSNGLAEWDKFHSSNVNDTWNIQIEGKDGHVVWRRENSRNDGGSVGVVQTLDADVSGFQKLILALDVMVKHHSLSNPGWWSESRGGSGEYPVKIILFYEDAGGNRHMWTHGFISSPQRQPVTYRDPKSGREEVHDEQTTLANFSIVPRDQWYRYEVDLLEAGRLVDADLARRGRRMPRPHRITMIRVVGQGWDFAAAVDNITLYGN